MILSYEKDGIKGLQTTLETPMLEELGGRRPLGWPPAPAGEGSGGGVARADGIRPNRRNAHGVVGQAP